MRTRRFIPTILLLGLALSCVKEQGPEIGSNDIELKAKVGRVQLSTKGDGVLGPDYAGKMYLGLMRIDEHDAAYPVEGFKATTAMGPLTATMQGDELIKPISFNEVYQTFNNDKDGVKYASWYPWYKLSSEEASGAWKFNKTDAIVTYPDIDGSTDILYGTVTEGRRNKDFSTIEFNHALCKFRIQAYAMEAYDANGDRLTNTIENWGAIEDIKITGLPSECYIALPSSGTSSEYTISYSTTLVKDFYLSKILGLAKDEPILDKLSEGWSNKKVLGQFMAPPPSDGVLRLEIKTANKSASQGITIARDFKAGHHYDVVLRFSDHGLINCTVEVGEWKYDPDPIEEVTTGEIFYDLGADQTANCYMVSSSNYNYSFQATVKGNGDMGAYNGQDINLSPNYVDVIWMDSSLEDTFKLMSNNLSEGRVIFSVKNLNELGQATGHALKAKGNVLIGVYSDAYKSQLLWTWHLWITDKPGEQSYNNGFVVQDRNLGATAMKENAGGGDSDGLYYQWGRPTPFPMRNTLSSPSSTISFTVNPGGVKDGTVETAISNPTYFYENGAFDETGARKRLWGWTSEHDEYSKTIYDPCPPGYRVSSNKIWTEIDFSDTRNNLPGDTHNHEFLMKPKSGTILYYPMSGVYRVVDGTLTPYYYWSGVVGTTIPDEAGAFLWTSSYNEEFDQAYYMRMLQKNSGGSLSLEVSTNNNSPVRGSALPVRCVKESSKAHVINLSEAQTANSYVISSSGYYKFNASVKGNGVGELVGYDGSTSLDIREGSPVSIKSELDHVDFLWWQGDLADGNRLDPVNNISLINGGKPDADGFVKFGVSELPKGNLIMAAYDGRGSILWSWHFWFTDEPKLMKCHDYVIMDRFLGATYAPPKSATWSEVSSISDANLAASMGFYYQWGRKDPFPGPSLSSLSSNSTTAFNSWWKYEGGSWVEKNSLEAVANGDDQSISSITAAPTTFSSCDETYPDITGRTLPDSDFSDTKNLTSRAVSISNTTVSEALWGYYSASGFGLTTSKTIYDPCPPGYVVCYYLLWRTADRNSGSDYYSSFDHYWRAVDSSYPEAIANKGFLFDPNRFASAGFDSIWYPFTGYLDPQVNSSQDAPTFKQVRLQGQFFTSTPAGKGARSFIYNTSGTGNIMTSSGYNGVPTSFGFPVRCQKQ